MTPALIRGDDGGLHVRRFSSQEDATQACAAHETSLFPVMTPDIMAKLIRVARRRRMERRGAWLTALHNFLAGSGAGAGRTEKRAAEAGEVTNFVRQQKRPPGMAGD